MAHKDDLLRELAESCLRPLVTTKETADFLRCSRRQVYRLIDDGQLQVLQRLQRGSSRILITRTSMVAYLESITKNRGKHVG